MLSTTILELFFTTATWTESVVSPFDKLVLCSGASFFGSFSLDLSPFSIALAKLNLEDFDAALGEITSGESSSIVASLAVSSSWTMLMSSKSKWNVQKSW